MAAVSLAAGPPRARARGAASGAGQRRGDQARRNRPAAATPTRCGRHRRKRRPPTEQGADEAAEAEPGVQRGQDRPAPARLHLHPDGVGRHVDRAGRGAEEQGDAQRRDRLPSPAEALPRPHRGDHADPAGAQPGAHAPVTRMEARAPRDMKSTAIPSALCEAPTWVATSGTRAAQLPKTTPSRTKSAVTAARRRATDGGRHAGADRPGEIRDRYAGARQGGQGGHGAPLREDAGHSRLREVATHGQGRSTRPRAPVYNGVTRAGPSAALPRPWT